MTNLFGHENDGPELQSNLYYCTKCKYLKRQLLKSGRNPIYYLFCNNDKVNKKLTMLSIPEIPDDKLTPLWCPLIESTKRDNTINKIIE